MEFHPPSCPHCPPMFVMGCVMFFTCIRPPCNGRTGPTASRGQMDQGSSVQSLPSPPLCSPSLSPTTASLSLTDSVDAELVSEATAAGTTLVLTPLPPLLTRP